MPGDQQADAEIVRLALAAIVLFAISTAFPIAASLVDNTSLPKWIGVLDVALAAAVIVAAMIVEMRAQGPLDPAAQARALTIYRASGIVPLGLLVVFFTAGRRVDWTVLLCGLAWRGWVALYVLPGICDLLSRPSHGRSSEGSP